MQQHMPARDMGADAYFTKCRRTYLSRDKQCGILTSVDSGHHVQPPLSLETPNEVQSVA